MRVLAAVLDHPVDERLVALSRRRSAPVVRRRHVGERPPGGERRARGLSHSDQKAAPVHCKPRVGSLIGEKTVPPVKREMTVEFVGGEAKGVRDARFGGNISGRRIRRSRAGQNLVLLIRRRRGGPMQTNSFDVIRIPTNGPGDVSGLMALIDSGALEPQSILAVLGKTEGNGGVNDFTREYAVAALCNALAPHLALPPRAVESRIAFVMSGGTEGVLSPHMTVFARSQSSEAAQESVDEARLSVGIAHSRD